MTRAANAQRGETELIVAGETFVVRPSFENLVAAEDELGSLFALVERASDGALTLTEIATLLWHCLATEHRPARKALGEAVLAMGLVAATGPVRSVLSQVLQGKS